MGKTSGKKKKRNNKHLIEENTQMANMQWKYTQCHSLVENYKLKQEWYTALYYWNDWNTENWQSKLLARMHRNKNF